MVNKTPTYFYTRESLIEGLPAKESAALRSSMQSLAVARSTVLFEEKSLPKGIFILNSGLVKIYQSNPEGKEHIHCFYSGGESFGYRATISQGPNPVSAKTIIDSDLSFIPAADFLRVMSKSVVLPERLLRTLSRDYSAWAFRNSAFAGKKTQERVAMGLLVLMAKVSANRVTSKPIVISISRDDLAAYVGAAKETVVRILRRFKDENIISANFKGDITVLRPAELEEIARSN